MNWESVRDFFVFRSAERADEGFRAWTEHLGRRGLRACAYVEFVLILVTILVREFTAFGPKPLPLGAYLYFTALGLVALAVAGHPRLGRQSLWTGRAIGCLTGIVLVGLDMLAGERVYAMLDVLMIMLVGLALILGTFWDTLAVGVVCCGTYYALLWRETAAGRAQGLDPASLLLAILILLCAALSALNYGRLRSEWAARIALIEAESRSAQAQAAASTVRLAAALSHELNSPLGALESSVDSLAAISSRIVAKPEGRLLDLQRDVISVIRQSTGRLSEIVHSMQRFTNLDRADVQSVDIRQMIDDVVALCGSQGAHIHVDIPELPRVMARPQALSQALAGLLTSRDSELHVSAAAPNGSIELRIEGLSLPDGEAADPGFAVDGTRVGTRNWELFNARQVVRALGGNLHVAGGQVLISLPRA